MCGIFGAIGQKPNIGIIRALAIANRQRGKDSTGIFDNSYRTVKSASDPLDALSTRKFNDFLDCAKCMAWFVAGHTRHATHGSVTKRKAHPFRFNRMIGAHNGVVDYPNDRNYQVDSEYLIDQLDRHNGNYQTALSDIDGYWGLSWFDGQDFYLQAMGNKVSIALADSGIWYYSSDRRHLEACMGRSSRMIHLSDGATLRFVQGVAEPLEMPKIVMNPLATTTLWNKAATSGAANGVNGFKSALWPAQRGWTSAVETDYRGYPKVPAAVSGFRVETNVPIEPTESMEPKVSAAAGDFGFEDFAVLDQLAMEYGYSGANDFMRSEGIHDEREALDYLEDVAYGQPTDIEVIDGEFDSTGEDRLS